MYAKERVRKIGKLNEQQNQVLQKNKQLEKLLRNMLKQSSLQLGF